MTLATRSRAALSLLLALAATAALAADAPPAAPAPASAADWASQAAADRAAAKAKLDEYAQVDAAGGVYQLPIAVAMDLMLATPDLLAPMAMAQVDTSTMTPVQLGEHLFTKVQPCTTCHSTDGSPKLGPTMKGAWGRTEKLVGGGTVTVDEAYIRESIANPFAKVVDGFAPIMPPLVLKEEEVAAIVAYIQSLK